MRERKDESSHRDHGVSSEFGLGPMFEDWYLFGQPRDVDHRSWIIKLLFKPATLLVIGLVALLIGGGAVHYKKETQKKARYMALATQKKPAFLYVAMRCGERSDSFEDARQAYESGNYDLTVQKLKEILAVYPTLELTHYNLGVAYLLAGNYDDSIAELQSCIPQLDGLFEEQARWYLAHAYLKAGRGDEAQRELDTLIRTAHTYRAQAQHLSDRIKQIRL